MLIVSRERSVTTPSLHHFNYSIQNGGIYCVCKEGYIGMGTISSPCKPVWSESRQFQWFHWFSSIPVSNTLRALASPLENQMETCVNVLATLDTKEMEHGARVRSLSSFPHQYLSHSGIDVCQNVTLNDCDPKAKCVSIQGGHYCVCPEGTTGTGKKGDCNGKKWRLIPLE